MWLRAPRFVRKNERVEKTEQTILLKHLLEHAARRKAHIGNNPQLIVPSELFDGFPHAFNQNGRAFEDAFFVCVDQTCHHIIRQYGFKVSEYYAHALGSRKRAMLV